MRACGQVVTTISQSLLLVSCAGRPEIDSSDGSYILLLVSSAAGHTATSAASSSFADSKTK